MMDNSVLIAISEIADNLDAGLSLEDRLKSAMEAALNHWLIIDESKQYQSAIGAVLSTASEEEKERIEESLTALKYLEAMVSGVAVDLDYIPKQENPLKLMGIWHEARKIAGGE